MDLNPSNGKRRGIIFTKLAGYLRDRLGIIWAGSGGVYVSVLLTGFYLVLLSWPDLGTFVPAFPDKLEPIENKE